MTTQKLFVDKTVVINAPAAKVWEILTERGKTDKWAAEFSKETPGFHIEADWQMGGKVEWKDKEGKVHVEGKVTKLEPDVFLRYTVIDTRDKSLNMGEEDGISFQLTELAGSTMLRLLHGDFAIMPEGEKYHKMSEEVWDRVLPLMKDMAEK